MNDCINKEWCSLTYMTIDDVAARIMHLGRGALMANIDLKSAYRQVPVVTGHGVEVWTQHFLLAFDQPQQFLTQLLRH